MHIYRILNRFARPDFGSSATITQWASKDSLAEEIIQLTVKRSFFPMVAFARELPKVETYRLPIHFHQSTQRCPAQTRQSSSYGSLGADATSEDTGPELAHSGTLVLGFPLASINFILSLLALFQGVVSSLSATSTSPATRMFKAAFTSKTR